MMAPRIRCQRPKASKPSSPTVASFTNFPLARAGEFLLHDASGAGMIVTSVCVVG
jgi:hypothetical protein